MFSSVHAHVMQSSIPLLGKSTHLRCLQRCPPMCSRIMKEPSATWMVSIRHSSVGQESARQSKPNSFEASRTKLENGPRSSCTRLRLQRLKQSSKLVCCLKNLAYLVHFVYQMLGLNEMDEGRLTPLRACRHQTEGLQSGRSRPSLQNALMSCCMTAHRVERGKGSTSNRPHI
jgi:hypothetical protein